jgi:CheY-like chemotaxis protein
MTKPILLVEDSEADAQSFQLVLKQALVGNPVFVVGSGDEAIAFLQGEGAFANRELFPTPGIMFLDLNLPGTDGFDVLEWARGNSALDHILVVVLSGHHGAREVNHTYALGADSFLIKPCHPEDIQNLAKNFPEHWTFSTSMPLPTHNISARMIETGSTPRISP